MPEPVIAARWVHLQTEMEKGTCCSVENYFGVSQPAHGKTEKPNKQGCGETDSRKVARAHCVSAAASILLLSMTALQPVRASCLPASQLALRSLDALQVWTQGVLAIILSSRIYRP